MPLQKPVYFYFYDPDPNGIIQTVTTLIAVENYTYGFVLPETGGTGTLPLAIIGFAMTAFPILYSTIRRKRERRLT
jgi:LPXTG-motif cell wall-anchored protein